MDIRQLEYLAALAQEKHFTRAAARCNVTQPTLSGRIRQLEQELGVPIVERGQRYHGLTAEGQRVLKWAQVILEYRSSMMQDLSELKGGLSGRLVLGVIPSALPMATSVTRVVRREHPSVSFTVHSATSNEILRDVQEFHIDAGITYLDNEPVERVETLPLYMERYCLFLPKHHAWAGREQVTWAEAAQLPLCLLTPDMQNRRIIAKAFRSVDCNPEAEIETDSVVHLWAQVRFSGWASVMPEYFSELFGSDSGIRGIPLHEPDVEYAVGLVALAREPLSPTIHALFEACRANELLPLGEPVEPVEPAGSGGLPVGE
ncbi:LysR family transcriptional regulator [Arhodomonas aquaeolei]|uniref:LysR family transcriptional regulator n=1 Tax=Arhodomonas aquaeolei TaxID=2369 RepID=UPI00035FF9FF|nr:LysR family transcriptional regulator [Arhodomonas aquaeolei]